MSSARGKVLSLDLVIVILPPRTLWSFEFECNRFVASFLPCNRDKSPIFGNFWERKMRTESIRSEEHTSELQSLMRISYAVFCLKKKKNIKQPTTMQAETNHTHTHKLSCNTSL